MASKYVDYNGGQNKRLPDWAMNLLNTAGDRNSLASIPAAAAFLALTPVLSPMAAAGDAAGVWGKTPQTTTPTWQGKEIADADAKRMALKLMLERQAGLSGPPPTKPRANPPSPGSRAGTGYKRPARNINDKPRAQGM